MQRVDFVHIVKNITSKNINLFTSCSNLQYVISYVACTNQPLFLKNLFQRIFNIYLNKKIALIIL